MFEPDLVGITMSLIMSLKYKVLALQDLLIAVGVKDKYIIYNMVFGKVVKWYIVVGGWWMLATIRADGEVQIRTAQYF